MIGPMGKVDFQDFKERVLQDQTLQERLKGIAVRLEFIDATVRLGAELGYSFTADDVEEALRESRREWTENWI